MATQRDPVHAAFEEFGAKVGLKKRAKTWYARTAEVLGIVNLQKSQWGPQYYVNLAFWFVALGADEMPKEREAHIRTRLDALLEEAEAAELRALLDLETSMDDSDRRNRLLGILDSELAPTLKQFSSVAAFNSPAGQELLSKALVRKEAYELVGAGHQ